jgi:hypothetical protein
MSERNLVDFLLWASEQQLVDEVKRLRAAVDVALALHQPVGLAPHMFCDYCIDLVGAHDTRPVPYPCATVRALAPVADPDPHTTSEKEQQCPPRF